MCYPWFDVLVVTAPTLLALAAALFSFLMHCVVGGACLTAVETGRALRSDDTKYRAYLKKQTQFLANVVLPMTATAALAMWFIAGMAAPETTQTLLRLFASGWGCCWSLFLLQLVSAFALAGFQDRLTPRSCRAISGVFALSSWMTLVFWSSIVGFMLNSTGALEDWESTGVVWHAYLNVQFLPQSVLRTGLAIILGALLFLFHASSREKDLNIRERVSRRMRFPAFVGLFLTVAGIAGWRYFLPETGLLTLENSTTATNACAFVVLSLVVLAALLVAGPCRRPRELSVGQTLAALALASSVVATAEFVNIAVKRPYSVDRIVLRDQLLRANVRETRQIGLLYKGTWSSYALDALQEKYPDLKISAENYLGVSPVRYERPWYLEQEPDDENFDENGEGEESIEDDDFGVDAESELTKVDAARGFFRNAAAQRRLADQSGFTPISSAELSPEPQTPSVGGVPSLLDQSRTSGTQTTSGFDARQPALEQGAPLTGSTLNPGASSNGGLQGAGNRQPQIQREVNVLSQGAPERGAPATQNPGVSPQRNLQSPSVPANQSQPSTLPSAPRPEASPIRADSSSRATVPAAGSDVATTPATPTSAVPSFGTTDPDVPDPVEPPVEDEPETGFDESGVETSSDSPRRADPVALDLDVYGAVAPGNSDLLLVDAKDRLTLGRMVFAYHCNGCHAATLGYSPVAAKIGGRTVGEIKDFALRLNHFRFDMPPWAGTDVEAQLLAEYLDSIAPKIPANAFMKDKPKKEPKTKPAKEKKSRKSGAASDETPDESESENDAAVGEDDVPDAGDWSEEESAF